MISMLLKKKKKKTKNKIVSIISTKLPCAYIVCSEGRTEVYSLRLQVKRLDIFNGLQSLQWRFFCSNKESKFSMKTCFLTHKIS